MKNQFFTVLICSAMISACSERKPSAVPDNIQEARLQYDTAAVDSFSTGAASVDIVRQIKISSQKYQDSIKEVLKHEKEEAGIKAELELENKKKQDQEKKKNSEEKPAESSPETRNN